MKNNNPVLLIEDDLIDVMITQRAFRENNITNKIITFENGEDALVYLLKEEEKPCVILLDLNTPKMNGKEFLEIAKSNEQLKMIPVVVLTTSQNEHDIYDCYKLGVAGYLVKPLDYQEFVNYIHVFKQYWNLCEVPVMAK